jgi:hypothetical protein
VVNKLTKLINSKRSSNELTRQKLILDQREELEAKALADHQLLVRLELKNKSITNRRIANGELFKCAMDARTMPGMENYTKEWIEQFVEEEKKIKEEMAASAHPVKVPPDEVRRSVVQWFVSQGNKAAIYNAHASRKAVFLQFPAELLMSCAIGPFCISRLQVSKCNDDTFQIILNQALRDCDDR